MCSFILCPMCGEPAKWIDGLISTSGGSIKCDYCGRSLYFQMIFVIAETYDESIKELRKSAIEAIQMQC